MSNARAEAAILIAEVLQNQTSLSQVLSKFKDKKHDPKQASLIQALCFGVMRKFQQLEFISSQLLTKPLKSNEHIVKALLYIGLFQLQDTRIPDHAAISETVNAAKKLKRTWATALLNGTLRNYLRQQDKLLEQCKKDLAANYSHPLWLINIIKKAYPSSWQEILESNNTQAPLSIRVNQQKTSRDQYLELLEKQSLSASPIKDTSCGLVLDTAQDVTTLPGFNKGFVSVQDGAAQLAAELLALEPGQTVLDACAAPGGKTCHILEQQPDLNSITALDKYAVRIELIKQNIKRLKLPNKIKTIATDAIDTNSWWDDKPFDRILLDPPCTATGIIRRHPDIKVLRTEQDLSDLVKQQLEFLNALWPLLKPNGILVYSTCSILPQENTEVIGKFLQNHPDAKELIPHGMQILPGENHMDGFYYAKLLKS